MTFFKADIIETVDNSEYISDLLVLVIYYNSELRGILDIYAPQQCKLVTIRKPTPWSTEDIRPEKIKCRKL